MKTKKMRRDGVSKKLYIVRKRAIFTFLVYLTDFLKITEYFVFAII